MTLSEKAKQLGYQYAFPCTDYWCGDHIRSPVDQGMTYRQWLAGLAMQGMWSNSALWQHEAFDRDGCAHEAVLCADALLEELAREEECQPSDAK